ncbi:hypothetical protein P170DRAFT_269314 [Aspergillus steynii IBT 23096]|uniref:Uncharacterized protein n=1 Tax=Aspergillus steynii IBT 23096 TaxID=1392250 RepID=A0A2I2FW56_9EURO|nr:uncharacterized protein P170DRAFT_269314 [Aspergillus steynii IBT 23096]PLB44879.1 hypothetical protein P170DRAFT_269314 [Aspergillus steynii IBT 23096]
MKLSCLKTLGPGPRWQSHTNQIGNASNPKPLPTVEQKQQSTESTDPRTSRALGIIQPTLCLGKGKKDSNPKLRQAAAGPLQQRRPLACFKLEHSVPGRGCSWQGAGCWALNRNPESVSEWNPVDPSKSPKPHETVGERSTPSKLYSGPVPRMFDVLRHDSSTPWT